MSGLFFFDVTGLNPVWICLGVCMSDGYEFDLIVVGAGSGGVRCARIAAKLGAKVACIEERFWGGTCVNVGCVPKKIYAMGSEFSYLADRATGFGWTLEELRHDWGALHDTMFREVTRLSQIYDNLLCNAGVERVWGRARLMDRNRVKVGERVLSARNIVIATGSHPVMPSVDGAEHLLNSDGFFSLNALPKYSVVMGGGYIAVELAGILAAAGSETTLVYRGDCVLRGFDREVREHTQQCLFQRGVKVRTETEIKKVEKSGEGFRVLLSNATELTADCVFAAIGRVPNSRGLGLEAVGVGMDDLGAIVVDDHYQSTVPGIFAVGDVLHRKPLTPVALAEGMYVANWLFGEKPQAVRYDTLATAVFSQPSIGCVGLTEEQCRTRGEAFKIYRSRFTPMSNAFNAIPEKVLLKILVDAASDRVLGIHMVGDHAAEIMQGFAAAMTCGVTKYQLDSTIGIHPTVAEELVTMRDMSELVTP